MSETDIGRAIRKSLESLGYIVTRVHSGKVKVRGGWMQLADEGTPDHVVSCPDGRTIWLETKTEEGDLSEAQKEWHARARRIGHAVAVVRSPREAFLSVNQRSRELLDTVG